MNRGLLRSAAPQSLLSAGRIIWGVINSDGTRRHGTGYTSVHTSTGHYTITLDTPFAKTPCIIATCMISSSSNVGAEAVALGSFGLHSEVPNVVFRDEDISFMAIEPYP